MVEAKNPQIARNPRAESIFRLAIIENIPLSDATRDMHSEEVRPIDTFGSVEKTAGAFFLLLFVLSVPFWLLGFWAGTLLPAQLPISAFQAVCPLLAAVILTGWHEGRGGIRELFKRVMDFRIPGSLGWYLLSFLTMPVVMLLSYAAMRMLGRPVPEPDISFPAALAAFIVFFAAAMAEETG